ncbi:MAG: zinc ribbon domain-containing protein [Thermoplasmata archaeon]|nr:MAG: zinc ribbon domain-containing protein [Thermoplasmata archaeon]
MVEQFECESCGAYLEFDPKVAGLRCEFCGSTKVIFIEHKAVEEHDFFAAPAATGWAAPMAMVKCDSCGATFSAGKGTAGDCPFCNSPYVKPQPEHPHVIRPETLVPFKLDKNAATQQFYTWIGKGFFRPSALKKISRPKMLKGVYVPFWTYDCGTHSEWTAQSGYYYYETETYSTYENGRRVTRTRQVRKTRWVPSSGARDGFYNDEVIVASRGLDYHLVFKIYPFHLQELVPYNPRFLSGWLAEEYSIDVRQGWEIAKNNVKAEERDRCAHDVPGDTHRFLRVSTWFNNITYKHVLLPIWVASYHWKDKTYHFLINGQTGEVQGYAPISWVKVGMVAAAVIGVAAGLVYFFAL